MEIFTRQERMALAFLIAVGFLGLGVGAWRKMAPASAAPAARQEVRANYAEAAELAALPGIGPAMAQRIVEDRGRRGFFLMPEDLARVKGISPKVLKKLKGWIRFD